MTPRVINVTLLNSTTVDTLQSHNPLEVVPGDTVIWRFMDSAGVDIQDALIQFRGFLPAVPTPPPAITGDPQKQPFTVPLPIPSPKAGPFTVAATDRGLYLYVIIHNGRVLEWAVPLFTAGSFGPFFGGIIIRDPP